MLEIVSALSFLGFVVNCHDVDNHIQADLLVNMDWFNARDICHVVLHDESITFTLRARATIPEHVTEVKKHEPRRAAR
jgi:hypothetical protein